MTTFTVYRKEKGDVNPPVAIATGLTIKSYVDDTVVSNKEYLYSVGAVKNSVEKISDEIEVSTITNTNLLDMPFDVDINDHGIFGLTATAFGGATIQNGSLYVPSQGYLRLTPIQSEFNVGVNDFEFGFEVQMQTAGNSNYPCLFGVGTAWASGAVSMQFNLNSTFMCALMNPSEKDAYAPTYQPYDGATWAKYIVRRVAGVVTTYKDNVAGTPLSDDLSINFAKDNTITIGAGVWAVNITASHSRIKNLYLKTL